MNYNEFFGLKAEDIKPTFPSKPANIIFTNLRLWNRIRRFFIYLPNSWFVFIVDKKLRIASLNEASRLQIFYSDKWWLPSWDINNFKRERLLSAGQRTTSIWRSAFLDVSSLSDIWRRVKHAPSSFTEKNLCLIRDAQFNNACIMRSASACVEKRVEWKLYDFRKCNVKIINVGYFVNSFASVFSTMDSSAFLRVR